MVIQLHTPFFRREPPVSAPSPVGRGASRREGANPFTVIALVVFLAVAALSAGVFLYRGFLIRDIRAMDAQLAAARKSFEPEFVGAAARLDTRLRAAGQALSRHLALSLLFDLLERRTLETVRFRDFSFEAKDEKSFTLALSGEAKSFNAVALQSDVFGGEKRFTNPVFSNFTLSERGNVLFQFKTGVDPGLIAYRAADSESAPATGAGEGTDAVFDEPSPFESEITE